MAIKKRCIRCLKVLREDGTCANPACPKHVEEVKETETNTETTKN